MIKGCPWQHLQWSEYQVYKQSNQTCVKFIPVDTQQTGSTKIVPTFQHLWKKLQSSPSCMFNWEHPLRLQPLWSINRPPSQKDQAPGSFASSCALGVVAVKNSFSIAYSPVGLMNKSHWPPAPGEVAVSPVNSHKTQSARKGYELLSGWLQLLQCHETRITHSLGHQHQAIKRHPLGNSHKKQGTKCV